MKLKSWPNAELSSPRTAPERKTRSRHASCCWRYAPSVMTSLFCAATAKPLVVPPTEPVPPASPSPNACVPRTRSPTYCAPIEVCASRSLVRLYDAVAFRLLVYVYSEYGLDVALPMARRSGSGIRPGGVIDWSVLLAKSMPVTPLARSHDSGDQRASSPPVRRSTDCEVVICSKTSRG